MKNFSFINVFALIFVVNILSDIHYDGIIAFYIRPYSEDIQKKFIEARDLKEEAKNYPAKVSSKTEMPFYGEGLSIFPRKENFENIQYKFAKKILKNTMIGVDGVYVFYKGFSMLSDNNGRVVFPNLEENKEIYVIITSSLTPNTPRGVIPINFKISNDAKVKGYKFSPKKVLIKEGEIDKEREFFNIEEFNIIPGNIIPTNAIIINSNPDYIDIEKEPVYIDESKNIILPDLIILPGFSSDILAISTLASTNYFAGLNLEKAKLQIEGINHEIEHFKEAVRFTGN